ncbi:MAG: FHA domain-containing protein [Eubacteriales bacterium]|nr:FHA domain-containing protein [Eubacteriales bacterium]
MITKCSNGHWYDTSVHKECPHCRQESERLGIRLNDVEEDDKTVSLAEVDASLGTELSAIMKKTIKGTADAANQNGFGYGADEEDDDKTLAFGFWGITNHDPVVGWLICISGSERGNDYRLHAGRNFIGRSTSMDVVLVEDRTIARDKHGSVTYDPKGNTFYVTGEGGNLVYLNGELLDTSQKLKEGDVVTVGETKLMFIPFCREGRTWEEE